MAFATLALAAGGAKVLTGLAGARNQAQSMLDMGRDTMLTARHNINRRKIEGRYNQFQILEQGHKAAGMVARQSLEAEGSAMAGAGASGAIAGEGTPRAVLTKIAQDGLAAQRDVILNAKNQIKAVGREVTNANKAEWKGAVDFMGRARKDAKQTIDNSRMQAVADIAETAASVYSAGTAGGTKAFSWGLEGAKTAQSLKGIGAGQDSRHRGGSRYQSPQANIKIPSRTHNPNRRQGSRYQFGVTEGSRKASGVGSFNQPLGSGQMPVTGWRWKKYDPNKGMMYRKGYGDIWKGSGGPR